MAHDERSPKNRALEAIRARPDVLAAGVISAVPFSGTLNNTVIASPGGVKAFVGSTITR